MLRLFIFILVLLSPVVGIATSESPLVGKTVPTFKLLDENNTERDFGELIDRPTIIYFTHNACHYCTQIIALLKRASKKFGQERLRIIGINVMARDNRLVKAYKEELGFIFPMFAGNKYELLRTYRINYVPVLVFIDSKRIIKRVVGHYIHEPVLHRYIQEIIE